MLSVSDEGHRCPNGQYAAVAPVTFDVYETSIAAASIAPEACEKHIHSLSLKSSIGSVQVGARKSRACLNCQIENQQKYEHG